jgi:quercetin dioxygenase-like cupin family protein
MYFYRFEGMQTHHFNPHLSSATGPILEGETMYFRLVTKKAGTGAELHYHPNELFAFPLRGKVDSIVGKDRRIVQPGTLVHFPPFARHGFKATEDNDLVYLYIKDRTWTMIGAAADEALPDEAPSAVEVARAVAAGKYPGQKKDKTKSKAIINGLGTCYYTLAESLNAAPASAHCAREIEGSNIAFYLVESPAGRVSGEKKAAHENFIYVLDGALDAKVGSKKKRVKKGDVIHVPRGKAWQLTVAGNAPARYAGVHSTVRLEAYIDQHGAADNWRG